MDASSFRVMSYGKENNSSALAHSILTNGPNSKSFTRNGVPAGQKKVPSVSRFFVLTSRPFVFGQSQRDCIRQPRVGAFSAYPGCARQNANQPQRGCILLV